MAMKVDPGHNETEYLLKKLELRISNEYAKAEIEITDKLKDYMRRFQIKDDLKKKAMDNGLITQAEYKQWRIGQIMIGKRWGEMQETIAKDLTNTAKIAKSIAYDHMPEVYAINHNYGTFQVEQLSGIDTSYTLYDRQTAEHILGLKKDEQLYHKPGIKISRAIHEGKQMAWDKKQVQSVMMQCILQGESIGNMASRLARSVGDGDRKAAIRNARTMATGAQNAGRVDSYKRAESMGIELEQEWLATLDGRTRHEHRILDGQRVKVGEKFKVEGYEIAYPADPTAAPEMVYNCRCTLIPAIKGMDGDTMSIRQIDQDLQEKTYKEWKESHNIHSDPITKQDDIAARMAGMYNAEYARYANSSSNGAFILSSEEDPVREVMGSAFESHPSETQEIINEYQNIGVELLYRKDAMGYMPNATPGSPGIVIMDREASYSAWLHERQHVYDDRDSGWLGFRNLIDPENAARFEERAYNKEIDFVKEYGYNDIVNRLEILKENSIRRMLGNETD